MRGRLSVALLFLFAVGIVGLALAQTTGPADVEAQRFVLPGTNTTGFRVHGARTEMNLRIPSGDVWAEGGYKVRYAFAHGRRVTASLTNENAAAVGTIGVSGTQGVLYEPIAYAGSIVAIAIASSQAVTAGYAHAEATIYRPTSNEFIASGLTALIGVTVGGVDGATRRRVVTQSKDTDRILSGEGVGCRMTTTSDIAPPSIELLCTVITEQ